MMFAALTLAILLGCKRLRLPKEKWAEEDAVEEKQKEREKGQKRDNK